MDQVQSTAIDLAMQFGPKLLVACLILLAGNFVGRWVGRMMAGLLLKLDLDVTLRILLVRMARIVVLGLFAILALQNLGVELLPLIAGLGVAGAGLALATGVRQLNPIFRDFRTDFPVFTRVPAAVFKSTCGGTLL